MTLPNILTVLRILLIPVFLYFLLSKVPTERFLALIIFIIASVTDFFDGYLARKLNQDSALGRFLDPFADKALVIATLIVFLILDPALPIWMVLVIIGRDMLVTLMRYLAIRKGMEVRTTRLAKSKTAFQMISLVLIMMIFIVRSFHIDINRTFDEGVKSGKKHHQIAGELIIKGFEILRDVEVPREQKKKIFAESAPYFLLLLTTIITIISGVRYMYTNYKVLLPPYYIFRLKNPASESK
ncbi:MAG: CDP-diacylglycerol--glycerol-3-phosphate 3-phosphatidyltransferase [Leptospiraceae bacterium]|nr:CDP-diacylglycerol--glycerol-3-phosphate 3-phosphatidyltransferase [Leptospiraceae bacterium]